MITMPTQQGRAGWVGGVVVAVDDIQAHRAFIFLLFFLLLQSLSPAHGHGRKGSCGGRRGLLAGAFLVLLPQRLLFLLLFLLLSVRLRLLLLLHFLILTLPFSSARCRTRRRFRLFSCLLLLLSLALLLLPLRCLAPLRRHPSFLYCPYYHSSNRRCAPLLPKFPPRFFQDTLPG